MQECAITIFSKGTLFKIFKRILKNTMI